MLITDKLRHDVTKFFDNIIDEERSIGYVIAPNLKEKHEPELFGHFCQSNLFVVSDKPSIKKLSGASEGNLFKLERRFTMLPFEDAITKKDFQKGDVLGLEPGRGSIYMY